MVFFKLMIFVWPPECAASPRSLIQENCLFHCVSAGHSRSHILWIWSWYFQKHDRQAAFDGITDSRRFTREVWEWIPRLNKNRKIQLVLGVAAGCPAGRPEPAHILTRERPAGPPDLWAAADSYRLRSDWRSARRFSSKLLFRTNLQPVFSHSDGREKSVL